MQVRIGEGLTPSTRSSSPSYRSRFAKLQLLFSRPPYPYQREADSDLYQRHGLKTLSESVWRRKLYDGSLDAPRAARADWPDSDSSYASAQPP